MTGMKGLPDERQLHSLLVSDMVVASYLGDLEIDGWGNTTKLDAAVLRAGANDEAKEQRFALIAAANAAKNGGKHIELLATAQTFAQTKKHNRRYLRLADDKLEARAPTWKGTPHLIDHATWSMSAKKGTIASSKAVAIDGGVAFEQKLHVVKPDAVIGILDGTFSQFSIGWFFEGPILCSAHGCDVLKSDSCNCWPGDKVKLEDGRERVVEFIFTDYRGKETSNVVIPAVHDTHVDDVKAMLAAELGITQRITRTRVAITNPKENPMLLFPRVAAALQLTALSESETDEARVLAAVEALRQRAITAETNLATTRTQLTQAEAAVATLTAAQVGSQIATVLETDGYRAGKLVHGRDGEGKPTPSPLESFLRDLGLKGGMAVMKAQLAAMPKIVPLNQRQAATVASPELTVIEGELGAAGEMTEDNPYLMAAAEQTGQDVKDLVRFAKASIPAEVH